jgi:hypothetical protein
MSRFYYYKKKAEDLRLGDLFVDWVLQEKEDGKWVYGQPRRILNIRQAGDNIWVWLDDMTRMRFRPGFLVIVKEMA